VVYIITVAATYMCEGEKEKWRYAELQMSVQLAQKERIIIGTIITVTVIFPSNCLHGLGLDFP